MAIRDIAFSNFQHADLIQICVFPGCLRADPGTLSFQDVFHALFVPEAPPVLTGFAE
jgi:hypothetical protein